MDGINGKKYYFVSAQPQETYSQTNSGEKKRFVYSLTPINFATKFSIDGTRYLTEMKLLEDMATNPDNTVPSEARLAKENFKAQETEARKGWKTKADEDAYYVKKLPELVSKVNELVEKVKKNTKDNPDAKVEGEIAEKNARYFRNQCADKCYEYVQSCHDGKLPLKAYYSEKKLGVGELDTIIGLPKGLIDMQTQYKLDNAPPPTTMRQPMR